MRVRLVCRKIGRRKYRFGVWKTRLSACICDDGRVQLLKILMMKPNIGITTKKLHEILFVGFCEGKAGFLNRVAQ